jgi:hypothetical protein
MNDDTVDELARNVAGFYRTLRAEGVEEIEALALSCFFMRDLTDILADADDLTLIVDTGDDFLPTTLTA